jgi:GGDEF domain-containing protein
MGTSGVARDITDRKKAEETIAFQAFHDLLTGLPNRILFKDRLGVALKQAKRKASGLA